MKLVEYADAEMMMIDLAQALVGALGSCLRQQERVSFAVPGGTTPGPIFDALCGADLDWDRVLVLPTDERCVPQDHPRSNARLIRERLLTDRAAAASFLPLWDEAAGEAGLYAAGAALEAVLPLSVLLLGMGADMHAASLFPDAEGLDEALAPGAPPVLPIRAAGAGEPRVTLAAHVLDGALHKHVVVTGAAKREAIERARALPPEEAPVAAVWTGATVHWAP